jgi:DNA replication ATP-dependent helicase Dna2
MQANANNSDADQPQDLKQHECFLCTLDPKQPCHTALLEGLLVAALERQHNGEHIPIILIDTGTERVEVQLEDSYYRSLIKEIGSRADVLSQYHLTIRLYHLPTAPLSIEYKTGKRWRYKGNAYTMAVLEPDVLLNITDLNQAEYCTRQYLLNRLVPSTASEATIRGNIVHHCFKELLKEHDRGNFSGTENSQVSPLQSMQHHLEQAIELNAIDIALVDVSQETMRDEVMPHLESLARWYESESNTLWTLPGINADNPADAEGNQVRAETFLLAPEIGLRGRLDLFWQQTGQQRLLELKTGGAKGDLPKKDHRWQVLGYHALLAVRRQSKMKRAFATLLYSGTPGKAQAFGIRASIRDIQRVNETRSILVLNRVTGIPSAPPGPSRCNKCSMLKQCQTISSLLQWQPPATTEQVAKMSRVDETELKPDAMIDAQLSPLPIRQEQPGNEDAFFAKYYHLLQIEGRAGEQQQALLWKTPVAERLERGSAIQGLELQGTPSLQNDGWSLTFRCTNASELREGDEILLSDSSPITGEVVSGTITAISTEFLTVWTRELITQPQLVDRYENDLVHVRTLQNLLRWHHTSAHMQDLVAGKIRPRFIGEEIAPRMDFNGEQNLAIARALQMRDYLLIQGPPGTGKTSVIAEIVQRLTEQGQHVMLAAFTNQAVDNMLKRLNKESFHDYLRLGSERSVNPAIRPWLLKEQIARRLEQAESADQDSHHQEKSYQDHVFDILYTTPVVASTTATWSSDKYAPHTAQHGAEAAANNGFIFDVAIIDEAGQLTMPAILGALRFAKRFILVGDEKQLPPLVLSKDAAAAGLADSLFSLLKDKDEKHMQRYPLEVSACVPLRTQYRMNKWISNFSSTIFYDHKLLAHESIANRRIAYTQKLLSQISIKTEKSVISKALDPKFPLVFFDIHDKREVAGKKQSNAEARAVREVVAGLLARGIQQQDIGIIAPYRAQVANIRRHLFASDPDTAWQALSSNTPLSIDTVDRFQGGERLVIIISFATTSEPDLESQRREFLINPNRLNVALTRAQRKLILVGCVDALEPLPTFNRLITYCRSMHTLLTEEVPEVIVQRTNLHG